MNKPIPFNYTSNAISLIYGGKSHIIRKEDPNFTSIIEAVKAGLWDNVAELLSIKNVIIKQSEGRVKILDDDTVMVDNLVVKDKIVERLIEMFKEGFSVIPLMRFLDNHYKNPGNKDNGLFEFLEHNNLPVTEDGCFLAYKIVRSDFRDIYTGTMDNSVGKFVSMNRAEVDPDRVATCRPGLHVCSEEYLPEYGTAHHNDDMVILVKVNPRDVVAVPHDYNFAKMRTCGYLVTEALGTREIRVKSLFIKNNQYGEQREETPMQMTLVDPIPPKQIAEDISALAQSLNTTVEVIERVRNVRKMAAEGFEKSVIQEVTGYSQRQIGRILTGEAWKNIP